MINAILVGACGKMGNNICEIIKGDEVKEKIEANLKYPGTIKITVVRETRAIEEAK